MLRRILTFKEIIDVALDAAEEMIEEGIKELIEQGHKDTGRGIDSLVAKVAENGKDRLTIIIEGEGYLIDLDTGVEPSKVDVSLEAQKRLYPWAKRKLGFSASPSKVRRFVFLVVNKAAFVGYPLPGSYKFSKNGRRTGWIEFGIDAKAKEIIEEKHRIFDLLVENFDLVFQQLAQEARKLTTNG